MKSPKRPPIHPGQVLRDEFLKPLRLTTTEAAQILQYSRQTISMILNAHQPINPDMALRLSRAFNTTPHFWLNLQADYDLYHTALTTTTWKSISPVATT